MCICAACQTYLGRGTVSTENIDTEITFVPWLYSETLVMPTLSWFICKKEEKMTTKWRYLLYFDKQLCFYFLFFFTKWNYMTSWLYILCVTRSSGLLIIARVNTRQTWDIYMNLQISKSMSAERTLRSTIQSIYTWAPCHRFSKVIHAYILANLLW